MKQFDTGMGALEDYVEKHLQAELEEITSTKRTHEAKSLNDHEKALIYKYSFDGYLDLNPSLRKSKGVQKTEFGKHLSLALKKLPDFNGLVYRGVTLSPKQLKKYSDALKNNKPITEHSFISTSQSRLVAMNFPGNCLFRILSKTGKDIEKIAKFGEHNPPTEREVLFEANTTFRVLDITKGSGYTLITLEEI